MHGKLDGFDMYFQRHSQYENLYQIDLEIFKIKKIEFYKI